MSHPSLSLRPQHDARPILLAAEPGRYLVAESGVLAASVIGVDERTEERWVYLDVGGYNGMMEAVQTKEDRKSTRLNSSTLVISYAVFRLKKNSLTVSYTTS